MYDMLMLLSYDTPVASSRYVLYYCLVDIDCWVQELNEKRVTLMEGTALSERDLQRSRAESASAVFLLADRFSPNYQQEDLNVQFQVNTVNKCL